MIRKRSFTRKRGFAFLFLILALILFIYPLYSVIFAPPLTVEDADTGTSVFFTTDHALVWDRCVEVHWQITGSKGQWINGQGREGEGIENVCIDDNFARPQAFVILQNDIGRVYELPVESVLYSPNASLRLILPLALAVVCAWVGMQVWGLLPLPKSLPASGEGLPNTETAASSGGTRFIVAVRALIFVVTVIYVIFNIVLMDAVPVRNAPQEAYITETTVQQFLENQIRPLTVPLIYKLLGNDFDAIARFQWVVSCGAWIMLAWVTVTFIRYPVLKIIAFVVVLGLSLTRDIAFWNSLLISESLSNSLFVLLVAGWMWIAQNVWTPLIISDQGPHTGAPLQSHIIDSLKTSLPLLILTFLWVGTRDANGYVLLAFAALLILLCIFGWRELGTVKWVLGVYIIASLLMFAYQNHTANVALRWRWPLVNIIARQILPYSDRTQFFAERGMPTTEGVMAFAGQFAWTDRSTLAAFGDWLDISARRVYFEWLLATPVNSALTPIQNWDTILLYDFNLLTDNTDLTERPVWQEWLTRIFYPERWRFVVFTAIGLLALLVVTRHFGWDARQWFPILLLVLVYPLAFIIWYGDGFAVERHSMPSAMQWRLAIWMMILFAVDRVLGQWGGNRSG